MMLSRSYASSVVASNSCFPDKVVLFIVNHPLDILREEDSNLEIKDYIKTKPFAVVGTVVLDRLLNGMIIDGTYLQY